MKMTLNLLEGATLLILLLMTIKLVQNKEKSSMDKWNQFECGFNSMNPSHMPFSFQFFLISILFLIFDIEITMVLAFPLEYKNIISISLISTFLVVLNMGLMYEWKKGKIEWTKWMSN